MSKIAVLKKYPALLALLLCACAPAPQTGVILGKLSAMPKSISEPSPSPTQPAPLARPSPTPRTPFPTLPLPLPFPFPTPPPSPKASPSPPPRTVWPTTPNTTPTLIPGNLLDFFTRKYEQSFGVYDRGWLKRPDKLPNSGNGLLKIFQTRERAYGALDLTTLLTAAGKEIRREIPATEVVQVGDISDSNGGQLGGHGSHQNGLDADIAFLKRNHRVMHPTSQKANQTGFDEDFVDKHGEVTENFDVDANWKLIQLLVGTGRIDRIFIDQHIKKRFCTYAAERGMRGEWSEILRKLRHWPHHQDHLHIRITCPEMSKGCKSIAPIPAGDGCDRLLDSRENRAGGFSGMSSLFELAPEPTLDEHGC